MTWGARRAGPPCPTYPGPTGQPHQLTDPQRRPAEPPKGERHLKPSSAPPAPEIALNCPWIAIIPAITLQPALKNRAMPCGRHRRCVRRPVALVRLPATCKRPFADTLLNCRIGGRERSLPPLSRSALDRKIRTKDVWRRDFDRCWSGKWPPCPGKSGTPEPEKCWRCASLTRQ